MQIKTHHTHAQKTNRDTFEDEVSDDCEKSTNEVEGGGGVEASNDHIILLVTECHGDDEVLAPHVALGIVLALHQRKGRSRGNLKVEYVLLNF